MLSLLCLTLRISHAHWNKNFMNTENEIKPATPAEGLDGGRCAVDALLGSEVWILNPNRRVYRKDENGRSFGGPIHREMWEADKIVGETSRSWIIGEWRKLKIPKKGPWDGIAFSREEADQISYREDNRNRVAEMVRKASYDQLKRIEAILGLPNDPDQRPGESPKTL
jgi:hypothetical protein